MSVYANEGSSAGSVYAQKGSSGGSVYAGKGGGSAPPKHGGGLLHWVAAKAGLAAHDVKAIPGGLVQLGKDLAETEAQMVLHPGRKQAPIDKDLKGIAVSTKDTVRHPLRDPFQSLLLGASLVSGGGSLAGRAAAVSKAAGEGGTVADLAKAAVRTPEVRPRLVRVGDERVPLQASKNTTFRAVQGVHDKVVQRAIDRNPDGRVAAYGTKRVGGSIAETARYRARLRDVPGQLLDRSAKKLGGKLPGGIRNRVHQAALELASVNTTPERAAEYHLAQAEKGVSPARNRAVAKLYGKVSERGLLTVNKDGDVIVDAAKHPALAQTDLRLADVQGRGDAILKRYGVRDAEALRSRVDAPGKIRAGATYEKPTPAKAGKSAAVANRQKRVSSLEGRVARSKAGGFRTVGDAQARLTKLQREENAALDKIGGAMFGPIDRGEVSFRTAENRKALKQQDTSSTSGASGRKATMRATVREQMRAEAAKKVEQAIAEHPDHPIAAKWQARSDEIHQLQQALSPDLFEKVNRRALGHVGKPTDPQRHAQLEGALAVAQRDLTTAEKTAAARVKPTGIVGGNSARPGRGFVSYRTEEPKAPKSAAASAASPVVGEVKKPITGHAFTGGGIEHGLVPKNITGQAANHYHQIVRFVNTSEHRAQAVKTGSAVRRTSRDVLVRIPGEAAEKIPAVVNEILGKSKLTTDDVQGLHAALQAYKEDLVPGLREKFAADRAAGIGTEAPDGYRWVDRNVLGDLGKPGAAPRGRIARQIDNINSAVTAATVYFKIGHAGTRVFTNAATNIIQGSARPLQIAKSVKLWHAISDGDKARALAAAGQHGFASMPHEGVSVASKVAGKGAQFWARHADSPFRFNSIAYEARKAGFDTPAKFKKMLDQAEDPGAHGLSAAESAKVDWVLKRANREGIAYDRLNEFERRYLTRVVWFYPWIRGTANFAANTLLEHPYKSVAAGVIGQVGRESQQRELGDLPSYEGGLFKLGGGANPRVADFSTFSPFATPADIADVAAGKGKVADLFNPAVAGAGALAYKLTPYGNASNSPLVDALHTTIAPAWPVQLYEGFQGRNTDQSKRMFPKSTRMHGMHDQLLRALLGPGTPRRINLAAAHSAAARERSGR